MGLAIEDLGINELDEMDVIRGMLRELQLKVLLYVDTFGQSTGSHGPSMLNQVTWWPRPLGQQRTQNIQKRNL